MAAGAHHRLLMAVIGHHSYGLLALLLVLVLFLRFPGKHAPNPPPASC